MAPEMMLGDVAFSLRNRLVGSALSHLAASPAMPTVLDCFAKVKEAVISRPARP